MTGWRESPLKHAVKINPEVLPEDFDPAAEIEYVDIGNVDQIQGIVSAQKMYFGDAPSRARRVVRNGDTIVSTVRTYLKAVASIRTPPTNMIVSTGFAVLRPRPEAHAGFVGWLAQSEGFVQRVVANSTGVSYPAINPSTLAALHVNLPTVDEQRRIVDFLDRETARIDELIAKKERLIALLDSQREAWIAREVQLAESLGPPNRIKRLSMAITSGSRGWAEFYSETGALFVRIGNLNKGRLALRLDDKQYVQPPDSAELLRTRVTVGDVLVSITAIVGMVGVVDHDLGEAYINQHICLIRPKSQAILPKWMGYFLLSPKGQQLLRVRLYGGTKEGLGLDDIGDLTIPVPPTQAQEVAIKSLEDGERSVSQLCARLVRAISNLREYRTALISAAVTGQIDVSTYRKEPEAVMEVP